MANADVTRIASNIGALNSLWALQMINKQLGVAQTRLSTGKRINSAADDPAGLTIATKLDSRNQGLKVALGNIGDAKNLLAVAEAGVGRITDILVQMKNKASQGASDTMGAHERAAIQAQLDAYAEQIDDIVKQTSWNSNKLIDGSKNSNALSFQTGADAADVTNMAGLINLSATEANGGIGGSLKLAATSAGTGSTGFTLTPGTSSIVTTSTAATIPSGSNATPLTAGTYSVRVTDNLSTGTPRAAVFDPATWPDANPFDRYVSGITVNTPGTAVPGEVESGHYRIYVNDWDDDPVGVDYHFSVYAIPPTVPFEQDPPASGYIPVTTGGSYDTGLGFSVNLSDTSTWPTNEMILDNWDFFYTKDSLNTQVDIVELLDSNGNPVQIGANPTDGSGAGVTSILIDAGATGGQDINFGNGLQVHLAQKNSSGPTVFEDAITYATASTTSNSTYTVMTDGDGSTGGVALDDTSGGRTVAGNFRELMTYLEGKLDTVNSMMSKIGAFTGRMEFKEDQVSAAQINVEASFNRIMNANMAAEQMNASKFQILQQTAISMLAQANQAPASLLDSVPISQAAKKEFPLTGGRIPHQRQTWRFALANADVTRIASNIGALNSLWALQTINKQLGVAQTRLSTGKRINSAADDPAGLTIATKLDSRNQGLKVALGNIGDAKNLLAVAEAGVGRITDILIQMKNKASQGASDTMGSHERAAIQAQLDAYAEQIDDIVAQTSWNSNKLIDGSKNFNSLSFQTGADAADVTDMAGLINLAATTGTNNLQLADHPVATGASAALVAPTTLLATEPTIVTTGLNAGTDTLSTGLYTVQLTHGAHIDAVATEVSDPDNRVWTSVPVPVITTELDTGDYIVQSKDSDPSPTTATWQYRLVDSVGTVIGPDWTTYAWGTNPFNTGRGLRYGMINPDPFPKNTSTISETVIHYTHSSDSPDTLKLLDSGSNSVRIASNIDGTGAGTSAGIVVDGTLGSVVNFGNGVTVDLEALAAGASGSAQINYTSAVAATDYSVKSQGKNGVVLDDTSGGRTVAGNFRDLMTYLEGKLNTVNSMMSKIGAFTGRLDFKEDQVSAAQINVEASFNRIMNANMAAEQVNASKFQILQQTAISMLAQANQAPASLLTLFQ